MLSERTRVIVPASVARNAAKGLELRKRYGRGGTAVGMGTARMLARQATVSLAKVRHIARYFPRHAGDRLDQRDPPSNGWIAWLLWGGYAGRRWAEGVVRRHDASMRRR